MAFAYWMVLIAAILPYVAFSIAVRGAGPTVDPHAPRLMPGTLSGAPQRAHWAHSNLLECFPLFAAGVIIAIQAGVAGNLVDWLAGIYVLLRIAYIAAYVRDIPPLRSGLFGLAQLCPAVLIVAAAVR